VGNPEGRSEWKQFRDSAEYTPWHTALAPAVACRRRAFSMLRDKRAVSILFEELADRFAERPGGYTRVIKLATVRLGDAGRQALIEFVGDDDKIEKRESSLEVEDDEDLAETEEESTEAEEGSAEAEEGSAETEDESAEAEEESAEEDAESTEDSAEDDDAVAETDPQDEGEADVEGKTDDS